MNEPTTRSATEALTDPANWPNSQTQLHWVESLLPGVQAEARASLEAERDALREALDQALYGPSDEQAQIGRVCARCSRRLDDGEQHVETCPYISLAEVLDRA